MQISENPSKYIGGGTQKGDEGELTETSHFCSPLGGAKGNTGKGSG